MPWPVAIDALEAAVGPAFSGEFVDRSGVTSSGGQLLLMPAVSADHVGVKLVGIGHDNPERGLPRIHGFYVLFDAETLVPHAIIDGTALTTIRTAAQSAMVGRRLAAADAHRLVVFGTGPQARAHVQALRTVRPIARVGIVGRRPDAAEALCAELGDARPASPDDVADADLVVCATNSAVPVFDGDDLADDVCVIAIGSHTPQARELDDRTFARARAVLVEHHATARREAGDVLQALASGALRDDRIRDLGQLADPLLDPQPGIVVYKSVGMAYQDLAVAAAALTDERGSDR